MIARIVFFTLALALLICCRGGTPEKKPLKNFLANAK